MSNRDRISTEGWTCIRQLMRVGRGEAGHYQLRVHRILRRRRHHEGVGGSGYRLQPCDSPGRGDDGVVRHSAPVIVAGHATLPADRPGNLLSPACSRRASIAAVDDQCAVGAGASCQPIETARAHAAAGERSLVTSRNGSVARHDWHITGHRWRQRHGAARGVSRARGRRHAVNSARHLLTSCEPFHVGLLDSFIHPSSYVDEGAIIGASTKVLHFCHVMPGAVIGECCSPG